MAKSCYVSENYTIPETGTEGQDWIKINLISFGDTGKYKQGIERLSGHYSYRVALDEWFISMGIEAFVASASAASKVRQFLGLHTKNSDSSIYFILDHDSSKEQFMDKDRTMQNYLKIIIVGHNVRFEAESNVWEVKLMCEELS